ncbi:MAG: FCD domain-containing protein [Rhodobacteraceae bacterium]|nr:MAG: FCD domain-containing protein [Paracoccaceae bacterium]
MGAHEQASDAGTLTERAVQLLHRDILSGELQPGVKLGISGLVETYRIGATPIREALSRLIAQNLIVASDRRGFHVRELSREDLLDITNTRVLIEREGIRLSMLHGGDDWESAVIAHMHRLRLYVERHGEAFGEDYDEIGPLHQQFHASLLAGCRSPRLMSLAENLFLQASRYRRILMRTWSDPKAYIDSHEQLVDAILARDEDRSGTLLRTHLESTLRSVYPDQSSP